MRTQMVIGNWKMHGRLQDNVTLIEAVLAGTEAMSADIVICAPFPYLSQATTMLVSAPQVQCGAQNVAEFDSGAYTGEVAASMLSDIGCRYTLVGHSERRSLFGESDETIARKVAASLRHDVIPVLCVGETWEDREAGRTETVVARQLDTVMAENGAAAFNRVIVAYEPVWAIGTGKVATTAQAQEVHAFIRDLLTKLYGAPIAQKVRILYGGSMKPSNAPELLAEKDIDGGLIGGAALEARSFIDLVKAAEAAK